MKNYKRNTTKKGKYRSLIKHGAVLTWDEYIDHLRGQEIRRQAKIQEQNLFFRTYLKQQKNGTIQR